MANASFKMNAVEVFSENNQVVTAKNINVAANDLTTPSMAKAWVNFDGTLNMTYDGSHGPNVGNVNPIKGAHNVDYIIDRGTGIFDVHFENALIDANYSVVGSTIGTEHAYYATILCGHNTANANMFCRVEVRNVGNSSLYDQNSLNVVVFR